ncbi:MAG TPA: hypothetical protein PKA63_08420 [Oligoflexia bacterium]|nr:hypothetical protein [Oligoflexia bacterium]HMP48675.1 hypothetical protein [Oligoflexia bacterium]
MKRIKILFLGLFLLILFFSILLYRIDSILKQFKPRILSEISSVIGREVFAKDISINLIPKPSFLINEFKIINDNGNDLESSQLSLDINITDILSGIIEISKISINGLKLPVVILHDGNVEIAGINLNDLIKKPDNSPSSDKISGSNLKVPNKKITEREDKVEKKKNFSIILERITINNTEVLLIHSSSNLNYKFFNINLGITRDKNRNYIDLSSDGIVVSDSKVNNYTDHKFSIRGYIDGEKSENKIPYLNLNVKSTFPDIHSIIDLYSKESVESLSFLSPVSTDINLQHEPYSGDGISSLNLNGSVQINNQNILIKSKINNVKKLSTKTNIKIPELELSKLLPALLPEMAPHYSGSFKDLECEIASENLNQIDVSSPLIFNCSGAAGSVQDVSLKIVKMRGALINKPELEVYLNESEISLAKGNVNLSGKFNPKSGFEILTKINLIEISDILKLSPPDSRMLPLKGEITKVILDLRSLKLTTDNSPLLTGNFEASIKDFKYSDFNLFGDIINSLQSIPGLNLEIDKKIPTGYQELIKSQDTSLKSVNTSGKIEDDLIRISNLAARGSGYGMNGTGVINKNDRTKLDLLLFLDKELVTLISEKNPKFERYKESNGTVKLPLRLEKLKDSKPLVYPDAKELLKQQAGAEIRDSGKKALDKIKPGLGGFIDGFIK